MIPRILIVAGSDSGGGAGIQADIKTVTMLGGHAMTAITAITAQNTLGVQATHPVPTEMVIAQMRSCIDDIGVDAIKIGMIGSAATAHAVADLLEELTPPPLPAKGRGPAAYPPIVFDPVMIATSGAALADADTIAAFERLMRLASVITPNLPELEALTGSSLPDEGDAIRAAHRLAENTGAAVLAKGGHRPPGRTGQELRPDGSTSTDLLADNLLFPDGTDMVWTNPFIDTRHTHGTGCTLASGIAAGLGAGMSLPDAIGRAITFTRLALRNAPGLGLGHGPMGHQHVRLDVGSGSRLNQVTLGSDDHDASCAFYAALGLRRIVDSQGRYARFESAGGATLSVSRDASPAVYLEQDDLDAAVAAAEAAGIVFDGPSAEHPWLWQEAWTRDPAGNRICLYHAGEHRRYPLWRIG